MVSFVLVLGPEITGEDSRLCRREKNKLVLVGVQSPAKIKRSAEDAHVCGKESAFGTPHTARKNRERFLNLIENWLWCETWVTDCSVLFLLQSC